MMTSQAGGTKRVVYVGGCGRSGSTILGFLLGNTERALDLGEVVDFPRFEGRPNGFPPESDNFKFWQRVTQDVAASLQPFSWEELNTLTRRFDSHRGLLIILLSAGAFPRKGRTRYYGYLRALYQRLLSEDRYEVFVDSSKYPGRLYHLTRVLGKAQVGAIHLIRSPVAVANSMGTSGQGSRRGRLAAFTYYFAVNLLMKIVARRTAPNNLVLHYEELAAAPEESLKRISDKLGIAAEPAMSRVKNDIPLERGFVFNGNRMRMSDHVTLRRSRQVDRDIGRVSDRLALRVSSWLFGKAPQT